PPTSVLIRSAACVLPATVPTLPHPLSLPDALPISRQVFADAQPQVAIGWLFADHAVIGNRHARHLHNAGFDSVDQRKIRDSMVGARKSTRLHSSHAKISYAVFCLKKNKNTPSSPVS